jgi:F-type H+-transporting ATPase subunit delta
MAERLTLARPYAEATFKLAMEQGRLGEWFELLSLLATVVCDARIERVVTDPQIEDDRVVTLLKDICGSRLDERGENLVRLLMANGRLRLLPEIQSLFEELKQEAEAAIDVEVTSAYPLEASQQKILTEALNRKLGRDINLTVSEDKSLIGGVVIRAGDLVIDGSVKGYLGELATHLTH